MTNFTHVLAKKLSQHSDLEFNAHGLEESGSYIYLHGKIEDMNGFDIVTFLRGNNPKKDGVYPTKVYLDSTTIVYCTMFLWETNMGNKDGLTGLIAMNGDESAMQDAQEKYNAKKDFI